jgi:hypothetical protein
MDEYREYTRIQRVDMVPLAPGVWLARGGTHNSLIIEMADHLVIFEPPPADVSATSSSFAMAEYPAYTSISIPTIRERMKHALDGVRIVSGDILKFSVHDTAAVRSSGSSSTCRPEAEGPGRNPRRARDKKAWCSPYPRAKPAAFPPSEMAAYLMFDNSFLRYCSHCFH